jgi:two-component sensor histidine kinase
MAADPIRGFCFQWAETGGSGVKLPAHQGFGTSMIKGMISSQLGGEVNFHWREEGVECEIVFEL